MVFSRKKVPGRQNISGFFFFFFLLNCCRNSRRFCTYSFSYDLVSNHISSGPSHYFSGHLMAFGGGECLYLPLEEVACKGMAPDIELMAVGNQ